MTRWIRIVAAFAAGVVLMGIGRLAWVESRRTEGPILRSYEVPQDIAQEVRDALSSALSAPGKDSFGTRSRCTTRPSSSGPEVTRPTRC